MPKPILVIGGQGQLASSLAALGGERILRLGRPEVDFERPETISAAVSAYNPAFIVNAAAWTAVDLAETEERRAECANCSGPALLAAAAAEAGVPFIHVSTDYVFSGDKNAPYTEEDPIDPQTVYGRTKAAGERAVLDAHPKSVVMRTSWVYSPYGRNFVKTMLAAGAKNATLKVVGDQHGNPTSSDDLAQAILDILALIEKTGWKPEYGGLFHACGTGETTWHGLATATLQEAAQFGQAMPEIVSIRTEDWPTPAKRPQDSRMDCAKLQRVFGIRLPQWRDSLSRTVRTLMRPG